MPASAGCSSAMKASSSSRGVALRDDAIAQVRAVEAGDERARRFEMQAFDDLAPRRRVGGRGQRDARNLRESARAGSAS